MEGMRSRNNVHSGPTSSVSPSSSFSSLVSAGSMLQPAPPSNSSQSDIVATSSDYSTSGSPPSESRFSQQSPYLSPAARSLSVPLQGMGQSYSRPIPVAAPPPSPANPLPGVALTGLKLKRALAHRRKGSNSPASSLSDASKGKERADALTAKSKSQSDASARPAKKPKQLTLNLSSTLQVFTGRKAPHTPTAGISGLPPPVPPKPAGIRAPNLPSSSRKPISPSGRAENRTSLLVSSPGISAALQYISSENLTGDTSPPAGEPSKKEQEDWRASDSHSAGQHTVRPSHGAGTPRPLSVAESLNSTHTVVPTNRRLSALVMEAEYTMPEEDATLFASEAEMTPTRAPSPPLSANSRHRRSLSLNIGSLGAKGKYPTAESQSTQAQSDTEYPQHMRRFGTAGRSLVSPSAVSDTPTLTRTAASGIIAPLSSGGPSARSMGTNIRGRLAAWSAAASASPSPVASPQQLHPSNIFPQPPPRRIVQTSSANEPHPSLRQTAISMTNGLAPAAGFAMGFGKRAVERMGRAWGGGSSNTSNSSHSTSSIGSSASVNPLGLSHPNQSAPSYHGSLNSPTGTPPRRTPDAVSGTWSEGSHGSTSESDTPPGPGLGRCLRGPIRQRGVVFGRELSECVRETAIHYPARPKCASVGMDMEIVGSKALEDRLLPAIIVRCVQHLEKWGLQEEGLFRVSGRASHVTRLHEHFDTGADFDLMELSPGELDVHAVASIFKAYLRELPEPILTRALMPYFEAAMAAEDAVNKGESHRWSKDPKGPSLPSNPRSSNIPPTLRKPPSLSTFAMPSLSTLRPISETLIRNIASIIARLPLENRDLLRTVTELIKATAKRSKETKMPLSNLQLVFCPSLSMSPPLLRVLCEGDGIWNQRPKVVDEDDTPVLDIHATDQTSPDASESEDLPATPPPIAVRIDENRDVRAEKGASMGLSALTGGPRPRPGVRRGPVPTLYLDNASSAESSAPQSPTLLASNEEQLLRIPSTYDMESLQDDTASYVSALETPAVTPIIPHTSLSEPSPPSPLSSSANSSASTSATEDEPPSPLPMLSTRSSFEKPMSLFSNPSVIAIAAEDLPLPLTPSQTATSTNFPFPRTPSTPTSLRSRMSMSMSSPDLPRVRRPNRLSLKTVFRKLSIPSLPSPASATATTPASMKTALEFGTPSMAPALDLTIDTSEMHFGNTSLESEDSDVHAPSASMPASVVGANISPLLVPISSGLGVSAQTSIADLFQVQPSASRPLPRTPPQTSYKPLGVSLPEDSDEADDWAKSVLMAANAGLEAEGNGWRVRQAVRGFETTS